MRRLVQLLLTFTPSAVRVRVLRAMGHKIGHNCRISPLSIIVADRIEIGNDALISPLVIIYNLAELRVGRGSIISYLGLIFSSKPSGHFRAGERFAMGMLAMIDCTAGVDMGAFCSVGPRSIVYTHANAMPTVHGYSSTYEGVRLGDRVWLMMDVKVMPGVEIASDVHVAPTAFIARSIRKSGFFMNSYMAEKDVLTPLPAARRKPVDPAFLDAWFERVLDALPEVARTHFARDLAVTREPWGWRIAEGGRGRALAVIDAREGRPPPPDVAGPRVLLLHGNPPPDAAEAHIDCLTLDYRHLERMPFREILWLHFFVSHGMSLAEAETTAAA